MDLATLWLAAASRVDGYAPQAKQDSGGGHCKLPWLHPPAQAGALQRTPGAEAPPEGGARQQALQQEQEQQQQEPEQQEQQAQRQQAQEQALQALAQVQARDLARRGSPKPRADRLEGVGRILDSVLLFRSGKVGPARVPWVPAAISGRRRGMLPPSPSLIKADNVRSACILSLFLEPAASCNIAPKIYPTTLWRTEPGGPLGGETGGVCMSGGALAATLVYRAFAFSDAYVPWVRKTVVASSLLQASPSARRSSPHPTLPNRIDPRLEARCLHARLCLACGASCIALRAVKTAASRRGPHCSSCGSSAALVLPRSRPLNANRRL